MFTMKIIKRISQALTLGLLLPGMLITLTNSAVRAAANTDGYDSTRIFHAMNRARQGEDIVVAVIGGSITAGYAASTEEHRFTNLMTDWWKSTFPASNITLINAGIGGTGSDIGTHRLQRDVMVHDPDFIVVEFSVNDSPGEYATKMMEGLIRQILQNDSLPGVMMLLLKQESGATAQASHKLVGNHYDVPMVSFADLIDDRVAGDGLTLHDIYVDGIHPNDLGMQYIADFLIEELEAIYNALPAEGEVPAIPTTLPDPLITDVYAHTYMYSPATLVPLSNSGWNSTGYKWTADTEGSEISFSIDGNAISFIYTRHDVGPRGQVEAWIDDLPSSTYDAYWTETWGPGDVFALVRETLPDGEHILHIRISSNTSTDGHYFEILNICKAGNFEGAASVAKAGENRKVLTGTTVELDGSESFDPEGDSIVSYQWSILSAPAGSLSEIVIPDEKITGFTPDLEGVYRINLVVNDGYYNSIAGIKKITAKLTNAPPVAKAGNDTTVATRRYCNLNGCASSDPDGDLLLYTWELISKPEGGDPKFNYKDTPHPEIFLTNEGDYVFGLVVDDSLTLSEEDYVTVTSIQGYVETVNLDEEKNTILTYPNPAKGKVSVTYNIVSPQFIKIALYSLSGIEVASLVNENREAGTYNFYIDLNQYSCNEGIYVIKMITNQRTRCNKILKLNY